MRTVPCRFLASAVFILATVGCSKKSEESTQAELPKAERKKDEPFIILTGGNPPPKKETPKVDPDTALAEFREKGDSRDYPTRLAAIKQLREVIPPTHPRRADAFRALVDAAVKATDSDRRSVFYGALAPYADKGDVPELCALVNKDEENLTLFSIVTKRLKELRDPRCVPDAVKWLASRPRGGKPDPAVRDLLIAIGPPAEAAVSACVKPEIEPGKGNSFELRLSALYILKEIGTAESVPVLKSLKTDPAPAIRLAAQSAVSAIEQRAAKFKS